MKKFNLFLIAVILMGGFAFAQPGPGKHQGNVSPETRAKKMTERMVKELSLNESQAKELQAINLEFVTQMKANAIHRDSKGERPSDKERKSKQADKKAKTDKAEKSKMRDNMKEAHEARDAKLKKVLTEAQYTQYQKNVEQKAAERKSKAPAAKKS